MGLLLDLFLEGLVGLSLLSYLYQLFEPILVQFLLFVPYGNPSDLDRGLVFEEFQK